MALHTPHTHCHYPPTAFNIILIDDFHPQIKKNYNIHWTSVMKNIERKTIYCLAMQLFVIFTAHHERQIKEECRDSLSHCFYDNKKIVLICFDWVV